MISPLIKWDHKENHRVPYYDCYTSNDRRPVIISLGDKDYEFVKGHVIDGKVLFPGTGYLILVWETFAMMLGKRYADVKVTIEDIKFMRATSMIVNQDVELCISINRGELFELSIELLN